MRPARPHFSVNGRAAGAARAAAPQAAARGARRAVHFDARFVRLARSATRSRNGRHLVVPEPRLAPSGTLGPRIFLPLGGSAGVVGDILYDTRPYALTRSTSPDPTVQIARPGRPRRVRPPRAGVQLPSSRDELPEKYSTDYAASKAWLARLADVLILACRRPPPRRSESDNNLLVLYQRTQCSPLRVRSMGTVDTDAPAPWAARESGSGDPRRAVLPRPRTG